MPGERIEDLGAEAIELAKNSIVVNMRFMAGACARLQLLPVAGAAFATDGRYLRYSPAWAARCYAGSPGELARNYLHAILHCIFLHPFVGRDVDELCWDTACDIVVEHTITELNLSATRCAREARQQAACADIALGVKHFTAEEVYRHLLESNMSRSELTELRGAFCADDHEVWHAAYATEDPAAKAAGEEDEGGRRNAQHAAHEGVNGTDMEIPEEAKNAEKQREAHQGVDKDDIAQKNAPASVHFALGSRMANSINLDRTKEDWEEAALELGVQFDSFVSSWGTEGANMKMNLARVTRKRTDYREFLRKFAVMGEHLLINDDEFDYIYYTYGLKLYDNLPLIEPLEYTEQRRIRDFVIAIDTSASTKDGLVRRFLEQTYSILHNETSFSAEMNVTVVQCDAEITDVAYLKSRRDFDDYLDNLEIKGLGGTDFRPVFRFIDDAVERGGYRNLGGLIYFTDGQGTYPKRAPDYNVAFAFVDDIPEEPPVPGWAMKVQLEESRLMDDRAY